MVKNALQSLWAEPRSPRPPKRVWRDWALVAVLVPGVVLEVTLRDDLASRPLALLGGVALVLTLLWRRSSPLAVVAIGFGALTVIHLVVILGGSHSIELFSMAYVILLPYPLFRWGSGREATIGLAIVMVSLAISGFAEDEFLHFAVLGAVFYVFPQAAAGVWVRSMASARLRDMDQVKVREREQLARELHDTVAHHVSAIAIQAQAGRTAGSLQPEAALDALEVIEEAASRTLTEMRNMVGVLRDGDEPDLAPQRTVADIEPLALRTADWPSVNVHLVGDLEGLRPSVEAAIYRIAQESITNAVRHARRATRLDIRISGEDDWVRIIVHDDGEAVPTGRSSPGYGLTGMTERATLLGGTLEGGPSLDSGWTVTATLPKRGPVV